MISASEADTPPNGGYYGPGYRETAITHDRRRLTDYMAGFKHALLFMPKLVISDHMVVNAPNFRIAYHSNEEFRELFHDDLVELAHFERFGNGGPHFSSVQLREFCRQGRFHAKVPKIFQSADFDKELEQIQSCISRRVGDSARRDPKFTELALAALVAEELKPLFGRSYGAYDAAFRRMSQEYSTLGVIHFDPRRTFPGEKNIFDYMAKLGTVGTREQLIKKLGTEVGRAHTALIVRVEIELLDDLHAILSPELDKYRTWVRRNATENIIDPNEREEVTKAIDLSAVSTRALVSLTRSETLRLRRTDQAIRYFEAVDKAIVGTIAFNQLVDDLEKYIRFLNGFFMDRAFSSEDETRKQRDHLRILRGRCSRKIRT